MAPSGEPLRIEIIASTLVTGGAEKVIEALVRGLPAHGCAPRVLCLRGPGEIGIEIMERGVSVQSGISRFRGDPFVFRRLAALLEDEGDAIVLSLDHHDAMFWGAVVSRAVGVRRRVLAVHSTGLWKKGSSFSWSDRLVLRSYDRIVALARTHADYLVEREKLPRDRICVINNGVDTSRFRPAESEAERLAAREALGIVRGSFVVTAVAALRPEKNHSMLLASASRMLERRRDFVVLIVGEGPEEAKLRAMTRDRALEEHVRFMGRTNDVSTLLRAADASVLCSHGIVETFPLAVLEAMASGLPVVATDVGALREMLADGREGFIVPRGDVEALTATLLMLAEQPEDARRVGRSARERIVRDFSEERMLRGYADLFHRLASVET